MLDICLWDPTGASWFRSSSERFWSDRKQKPRICWFLHMNTQSHHFLFSSIISLTSLLCFLSLERCGPTPVPCSKACVRTSPGRKVTASFDPRTAAKTSSFTSQSEWPEQAGGWRAPPSRGQRWETVSHGSGRGRKWGESVCHQQKNTDGSVEMIVKGVYSSEKLVAKYRTESFFFFFQLPLSVVV